MGRDDEAGSGVAGAAERGFHAIETRQTSSEAWGSDARARRSHADAELPSAARLARINWAMEQLKNSPAVGMIDRHPDGRRVLS